MNMDILDLLANVILAPILIWFMRAHTQLIKQLIDKQDHSNEVISRNTTAMELVKEVIDKCEKK